jgi:hypothetical protein
MKAARPPPRSEPAESHEVRPGATPRGARSAAVFARRIRPSPRGKADRGPGGAAKAAGTVKASRRSALTMQAVALAAGSVPRHRVPLAAPPVVEPVAQRPHEALPRVAPRRGLQPIDVAVHVDDRVDPVHRLQGSTGARHRSEGAGGWRDVGGRLPFAGLLLDAGEVEDLAAGMAPARRAGDRPGIAVAAAESVAAATGVRRANGPPDRLQTLLTLQDVPPPREMPVGMGHLLSRGNWSGTISATGPETMVERGRRRAAGDGASVADLRQSRAVPGPPFARSGTVFALGPERMAARWPPVPLQPLGPRDMRADRPVKGRQRGGTGAGPVGQGREAWPAPLGWSGFGPGA